MATDYLHDHLTIGFRRGCVACAQLEADLAVSRKWLSQNHPATASPMEHLAET